jgi:hypothetical protein
VGWRAISHGVGWRANDTGLQVYEVLPHEVQPTAPLQLSEIVCAEMATSYKCYQAKNLSRVCLSTSAVLPVTWHRHSTTDNGEHHDIAARNNVALHVIYFEMRPLKPHTSFLENAYHLRWRVHRAGTCGRTIKLQVQVYENTQDR